VPMAILDGHLKSVNSISWAPVGTHRRHILASSGDDCQTLIWDTTSVSGNLSGSGSGSGSSGSSATAANTSSRLVSPIRTYSDTTEINQVCWNGTGDWVGAVCGRGFQAVRLRE
jgi:WD repeat-containing protein 68